MKKYFKFALSVLCLFSFAIILSCSDDDNPVLRVDNEVTKGIKADVFDNVYKFNVESNGDWTASLPENCDWARLMKEQGRGSSTIEILVDGNDTGADRKTVINIVSGNQNIEVPLEQTATVGGDAPDNEDENLIILAGKKYLGFGCNLMEFLDSPEKVQLKYKTCNIMNAKAINNLIKNDKSGMYSNIANTNELELTEYEDARLDTVISKSDTLGISLSLDVAYGVMKFGLKGDYTGSEKVGSEYLEIHTAANYPVLEASVNYAEIFSHYEAWQKEGKSKEDYRRGLLTLRFANLKDSLQKHCAEGNETAQVKDIKQIIANFGTGVVTRTKLGGMIALDLLVDTMHIEEEYKLDNAKIAADISVGGFTLNASVEVDYLNAATEIFKNSKHKMYILGGDKTLGSAVTKLFDHSVYGTELSSSIYDWAYSIEYNSKTAQLISFEAVPIWYMFQDEPSRQAFIKYFRETYPNSKFVKKYIIDTDGNTTKK